MRAWLLTILLAAPAAGGGAGAGLALARVNGAVVDEQDLAARFASSQRAGGTARPQELLEDLINDQLLAEDARKAGVDKDPKVVAELEGERRRLAAKALLEGELQAAVKVDEEAVRQLYRAGDSAHLLAIHFASKEEAQACLDRLRKGARFETEAARGLDPTARTRGGDLGWKTRAQMEATVADAAFSAKLNEPVGPVPLALGSAVLVVAERKVGDEAGFAQKRGELTGFAMQQARLQAREHLQQKRRQEAGAKVDEAFLQSTGSSTQASPKDAERVVATAGAHQLTYAQLLQAVQALSRGREGSHFSGPVVKQDMAWQLLDQRLFEDLALDRGHGRSAQVVAAVEHASRDALARALAGRLRAGVARPTEADLAAWYEAHKEGFKHPSARHCAHILFPTEAQARDVQRQAARGDFAALAKDFSADTATADKGGDLGEINSAILGNLAGAGELALADALSGAEPGSVAGPIKGRGGYHLVKCGKFTATETTPFAQVRGFVEERVLSERGDAAVAQRIQELRARAKVEIDRVALDRAAAGLQ